MAAYMSFFRTISALPSHCALHTLLLWLLFLWILCGCSGSSSGPSSAAFNIQGILAVENGDDLTQATVRLFAAPQDVMLSEILTDYPALGFSPLELMLFDPLNQSPIRSISPDSSGAFTIENVGEGIYILDAELDGFGCPQPLLVNLTGDTSVDTSRLYSEELISGIISETVWESGKVYRLVGDVIVPDNILLTIAPGVLITLAGDYSITITGGIQIDGSSSRPVRFRLSEDHFQSGGDWGGIKIDHPAFPCYLNGSVIQGAFTSLQVSGGNTLVQDCFFEAPGSYGVYFSADADGSVTHSIVRDGANGLVAENCDPQFSMNVVLRMSQTGIIVKSNSQAMLEENVLMDCETGIWSDWYPSPLIQYNLISGGSRAVDAQTHFEATIRYNVFENQQLEGIYVYNSYPLIENNSFVNMPLNILHVNGNNGLQSDTVFAAYNYWDGEDATGIPLRIVDGHDIGSPNNPVGPVEYEPFRLEPVSGAGP